MKTKIRTLLAIVKDFFFFLNEGDRPASWFLGALLGLPVDGTFRNFLNIAEEHYEKGVLYFSHRFVKVANNILCLSRQEYLIR